MISLGRVACPCVVFRKFAFRYCRNCDFPVFAKAKPVAAAFLNGCVESVLTYHSGWRLAGSRPRLVNAFFRERFQSTDTYCSGRRSCKTIRGDRSGRGMWSRGALRRRAEEHRPPRSDRIALSGFRPVKWVKMLFRKKIVPNYIFTR